MLDKHNLIQSLNRVYEESKKSTNFEHLVQVLEGIKINNLVNYYIHYDKEYDSDDIIIIELIIKILQNIYNNSGIPSPITDETYDVLYEIYTGITNADIVGGDTDRFREKDFHTYPDLRGTLDKVHFITNNEKGKDKRKSIEDWIKSSKNRLGREFNDIDYEVALYPKFDGVSVIFECDSTGKIYKALTRGNTKNNEAVPITRIFKMVRFRPNPDWPNTKFGVKCEVVMPYKKFKNFCKRFGKFNSPRSAVSSIINSSEANFDREFLKYIEIIPLRMQNYNTKEIIIAPDSKNRFPVIYSELNKPENLKNGFNTIKSYMKEVLQIPIDGIVLQFTNKRLHKELGRDGAINKYEVAYKFTPDSAKTKLLDVYFSVGLLGAFTPVAKVEPIQMEGNTISNVSLGSIDRFESLHLSKGDEVLIKYDIIPYLFIDDTCKRNHGEIIKTITHCPYCGERLINDPILRCVNNNCQSRMVGKIVNYIEKMNIKGISIGLVTTLFRTGHLRSIQDLYNLESKRKDIIKIDGIGERLFDNILKGIDARRTVSDYVLMGSIGITDIGSKIFKDILSIYYIGDIIEMAKKNQLNKLIEIPGIQEKTANKIIVGILQNLELINFLEKELNVKHDNKKYVLKVVFSKIRDRDFENYLDKINIEVCDTYSKKIDMVICEDPNESSRKVDKAKKAKKKVMSIYDAYKYFKYR